MAATPSPVPNYIDPETHGNGSLIAVTILTAVALCFVSARLYARFIILRRPGPDDYFIIPAMIMVIANVVDSLLAIEVYGWNKHIWDIRKEERHKTFLTLWLSHHFYITNVGLIKISILLFYLRVISRSQKRILVWTIIGTIALVVVYTVTFVFGFIFICRPVKAYFMQYNPQWLAENDRHCANTSMFTEAGAVINTITDLWITIIPLLFIRSLHMPRKQKWALAVLFSCGFLVSISSIVRTVFTFKLKRTASRDVTWQGYYVITWSLIEPLVAIMVASTPALKIYFREYFSSESQRGYRYSAYNPSKGYIRSSGKCAGHSTDRELFENKDTETQVQYQQHPPDESTANLNFPMHVVVKSTTIDISSQAAS